MTLACVDAEILLDRVGGLLERLEEFREVIQELLLLFEFFEADLLRFLCLL